MMSSAQGSEAARRRERSGNRPLSSAPRRSRRRASRARSKGRAAARHRPPVQAVDGSWSCGFHGGSKRRPPSKRRSDPPAREFEVVGTTRQPLSARPVVLRSRRDERRIAGSSRQSARRAGRAARHAGSSRGAQAVVVAPPRAVAHRHRRPSRSPPAARRRMVRSGQTTRPDGRGRPRRGISGRMLSATVARRSVGRCGTYASCLRHSAGPTRRGLVADQDPTDDGSAKRRSSGQQRAFPPPLARPRAISPGWSSRSTPRSTPFRGSDS